ncbi:MAG: hypothetical protein AAGF11_09370 [Myxococcota bacterium]
MTHQQPSPRPSPRPNLWSDLLARGRARSPDRTNNPIRVLRPIGQ